MERTKPRNLEGNERIMETDKQYRNPTPVAIAIVPVEKKINFKIDGNKDTDVNLHQVLYVQRNIEPNLGMLALPGGFVNEQETIETAGKRELFEETGLVIKEEDFQLFRSSITSNNRVLVFGLTTVQKENVISVLEENLLKYPHIQEETQQFVISGLNILNAAFPLHQLAVKQYLNFTNGKICHFVHKTFGKNNGNLFEAQLKKDGFLSLDWQLN